MSAQARRALAHQNDTNYDVNVSYDVNEYLIENWPTLPLKGRMAVVKLAQDDEEFDFSSIEEQIDDYVYTFAESSPTWNVPEEDDYEDDDEEEDDDDGWYLSVDLYEYFQDSWSSLTPEQTDAVVELAYNSEDIDWEPIYKQLDEMAAQLSSVPPKSNID